MAYLLSCMIAISTSASARDTAEGIATFLGGQGTESGNAVAVDSAGNIYVVGGVRQEKVPILLKSNGDPLPDSQMDVFVAKYTGQGRELDYYVTLGGLGDDYATAVAVSAEGVVVVGGVTYSNDFPEIGVSQTSRGSRNDGFLVTLDTNGNIKTSTYLGGGWRDEIIDIAIGADGSIFAAGWTESLDFPTGKNLTQDIRGRSDAFVAKLSPDALSVLAVNVFGGRLTDKIQALYVDAQNALFAAGTTSSAVFAGASAPVHPGSSPSSLNVAVSRLNQADLGLEYSVVLGGSRSDAANAISPDGEGNILVAGETFSDDFPVTTSSSNLLSGERDGFILQMSASDGSTIAASLFGGSGADSISDIAVDKQGIVHIAGSTNSRDLVPDAICENDFGGGSRDGFHARLTPGVGTPLSNQFIGGAQYDDINGIALFSRSVVLAGRSGSSALPAALVRGAQETHGGGTLDALVVHKTY